MSSCHHAVATPGVSSTSRMDSGSYKPLLRYCQSAEHLYQLPVGALCHCGVGIIYIACDIRTVDLNEDVTEEWGLVWHFEGASIIVLSQ